MTDSNQNIVQAMITGYGPNFPPLEQLFTTELTPEDLVTLEMPIPGLARYRRNTIFLAEVTSPKAIGLTRFYVLREYFIALNTLMASYTGKSRKIVRGLTSDQVQRIRTIGTTPKEVKMAEIMEGFTDHDTAAAGDYMKLKIATEIPELVSEIEGVHFACTSEDVMGNVFGLVSNELVYRRFMIELLKLCEFFCAFVEEHGFLVLPALTHEQAAEPTTLAKKFANRLEAILYQIQQMLFIGGNGFQPFSGLMSGAVGNLSCHYTSYPDIDWQKFAREFVEGLGLYYEAMTDQCVSYTVEANLFKTIGNILTQVIKLSEDFIKLCRCPAQFFVKQKKTGQKGSSIMPGKTNLWAIEGAIRMLKKSQLLLNFLADELQDYPDEGNMGRSYLFRDIGNDFMPIFIAFARIRREMSACHPNQTKIDEFFDRYPGMAGSCMQTLLKREGIPGDAYRILQGISLNADGSYANAEQFQTGLETAMDELSLPTSTRKELLELLDPAYLVKPANELADKTLAGFKEKSEKFKGMANQIKGLPLAV